MATVRPFQCVRPNKEVVSRVAALPYDVYNREEAKEVVKKEPLSFLNIDRAETQFDDSVDTYAPCVYEKASEMLHAWIDNGTFIKDETNCYYVYELIMNGRSQTGIVACSSIDDYQNNIIKKHENTRADKELDRIKHVDTCSAQTGPIFLAYRSKKEINIIVDAVMKTEPLYAFTSDDGVTHNVWKIADASDVGKIQDAFAKIQEIYIADGHHRAASAVKVGLKRREENPGYTGDEEFNYFLSVLFPHDQLMIMDYNRTVKDLNGYSKEEFFEKIREHFDLEEMSGKASPTKKAEFTMYLDKKWYRLTAKKELQDITDAVARLDVSLLQDYLLGPVLGIQDPRTDKRIDFIGGIRGLEELERRADEDMKVSFAMYPTSITELFDVADAKKLMPPKSTWFEPKLRSGIFIHEI
ncbi:MAG TPA: DUF1015 domain-containing protein [Lachnospiraceae bacterium]|nr:DUF1015 domain-containing protein [uncultured Lachnoclostridium sp.]HAU84485.1 DUF1015 domain-containing protein [Lachnospiraceae bacterium]